VAEPGPVAAVVCSVWDRPLSRALNLAGGSLVITIISYGNYSAGVNLLKKKPPPTSGYLRMSFWGKIWKKEARRKRGKCERIRMKDKRQSEQWNYKGRVNAKEAKIMPKIVCEE
jgi:hypothetical protein